MMREIARYRAWVEAKYGPIQPRWYVCPAKVHASSGLVTHKRDSQGWPLLPEKAMRPDEVTTEVQKALSLHGWTDEMLYHQGCHTLRRSQLALVKRKKGVEAAMASADHRSAKTLYEYTGHSEGREALDDLMRDWDIAKPALPAPEVKVPAQSPPPVEERLAPVLDLFLGRRIA